MLIGAVEGEPKPAAEVAENHAVSAVILEKRFKLGESARNVAVVGNCDALGVAALGESCPKAEKTSVITAPHERAVGYAARYAAGMVHGLAPACFGSAEKQERLAGGRFKVGGQLYGAYLAVAGLYPFVAENHIRSALGGKIESSVKALPFSGGNTSLGVRGKWADRGV